MIVKYKGLAVTLGILFLLASAGTASAEPTLDQKIQKLDDHLSTMNDDMFNARLTVGWTLIGISPIPTMYRMMIFYGEGDTQILYHSYISLDVVPVVHISCRIRIVRAKHKMVPEQF